MAFGEIEYKICNSCGEKKAIAHKKLCLCHYCNEKRKFENKKSKPLNFIDSFTKDKEYNRIKFRSNKGNKVANEDSKFFHQIWKERNHVSEISGIDLGDDYNPVFFSHTLTKGAYPKARHWSENIFLMTYEEHNEWEFGDRSKIEFKKKFKIVIKRYNELIIKYYKK